MAASVIGALRVNLGLDSAKFSDGLKRANTRAKSFSQKIGGAFRIGAAAAAAAAGGIGLAVRSAINHADDMAKTAQKIGIPVDELSRLKHAADLAGVSFSGLQTGVRRLSQNMNDAMNGIGEGKEAFEQLGISVTNTDGTLKTSSQVMAELADRFAQMPDGAEKTALALDLMGRSGADMIPLLNGGADALNRAMQEADALGIVIDEKTGKAAEQFNDNLDRLWKVLRGLGVQIAADLAPHLASLTDWLVKSAPDIRNVAAAVADFVAKSVRLAGSLKTMATDGVAAVSGMVTGIETWVTGRLNAIWDSVASKIEWVTSRFQWMYDVVVKNSYVPDMVSDIGKSLGGLDRAMVQPIQSAVTSAVGQIADGTFKAREFLQALANDILRMFTNRAINQVFGSFFGGGTTAPLNFIFGRALGGPVAKGRPYMVGEHGPELFTPSERGNISPNVMGGGIHIEINERGNDQVTVEGGNGTPENPLKLMVAAVREDVAQGGFDSAMTRFNNKPATVAR